MSLVKVPHGIVEVTELTGWDPVRYYPSFDGKSNPEWEKEKIVRIPLPAHLVLDWSRKQSTSKIAVHGNVAYYLELALKEIFEKKLWPYLGTYGGGYVWRTKRTDPRQLSMHAFGLAVDFSPTANPLGTLPENSTFASAEGMEIVNILDAYGWKWGGRFKGTKDPMHWQFAESC